MPKVAYIDKRFSAKTEAVIEQAETIIEEYLAQGFKLTLRQLYYQFVARAVLPNTVQSYKRLGSIVNDARLAGLIDWDAIEDRTRNLQSLPHWSSPESIIQSAAYSYRIEKWRDQPYYVEVWIEKDALLGVIDKTCEELDVSYFSCRGYVSQSEMWAAAKRLRHETGTARSTVIVHLGDHDPSGIDMTRDIQDRMDLFGADVEVERVALTMEQVEEYQPPPNPAKVTDSRFEGYAELYGQDSWELDALEPSVLANLIENVVLRYRDHEAWEAAVEREDKGRINLERTAAKWSDITNWLEENEE